MYFTITRAGLMRNRFRARLYGANNELVWYTQTYADKEDAYNAIVLINSDPIKPINDTTS